MSYRRWQSIYETKKKAEDNPQPSYPHSYNNPTQINHIFPPIHGRQTNSGNGKHVHFQLPRASSLSYDQHKRAQCPYCQHRYGSQEGFPFHKW